jgi:hypothetical protein
MMKTEGCAVLSTTVLNFKLGDSQFRLERERERGREINFGKVLP